MGVGKFLGKAATALLKTAGTVVLGTVGVASTVVEYLGAGSNMELLEEVGHGLKSASFNGVRKMWGAEEKEFDHSAGDAGRRKAEDIQKERERILAQAERQIEDLEQSGSLPKDCIAQHRIKLEEEKSRLRRTDEELSKDTTGTDRPARSFQYDNSVPLSSAMHRADNSPGVYILWLNGNIMKCGRSSQAGGVRKRLLEYYRLDYDKRAKVGDYWAVNEANRDDVVVSWQCCPISKCHELEYKLFKKYGKGPWAHRAPASCPEDTWELLI